MATNPPLLTAVTSSSRNLLLLLRCISFAKKAQVRISAEGIRISSEQGSAMEAFVFLEKALFSTYTYRPPPPPSSQDDVSDPPIFEVSMDALLEAINIFSLSDPSSSKRPTGVGSDSYSSFAAHRLNRHAGINAFSNQMLGLNGICTITYAGEGHPLRIHMSESNVTTTCDLTTYAAESNEEIPFARDRLALKTILRSANLLESITELSSLTPAELSINAIPAPTRATAAAQPNISLTATGALGSAVVEFTTATDSDTPVLETFFCPARAEAKFKFALIKAAQRAMAAATKVSLRLDEEGVLSLQFLVEMEGVGAEGGEAVAFVDFRVIPLAEDGEEARNGLGEESTDDEGL